ncbi:MAG: AAA family ATPase [Rhodospirillaceae bacterium]|nr:AAA family ATPase [Rhodospirillaceae bacterium]MYH38113.1 AAA family ATPase [Rhodospirillaceae bacterium]MYK12924.1 AAA family ATPase [Rhodospirillaceae bacterium]
MLTKLIIRNFKRFGEVEVELGNPVVFIGPNNSGKTSAMQALALWDIGVKRWNEKRAGKSAPEKRPGVTVNRRDLFAIPHPSAKHLWRGLHVRNIRQVDDRQRTDPVRIDLIVEGVGRDTAWKCGLEFDYANEESFYCRPLRLEDGKSPSRMPVPKEAGATQIAFLPPMSGLAATETRLDPGAVNVRVGEGRTSEVLRNLCFRILEKNPELWASLVDRIRGLFGVELDKPRYIEERGEIAMEYRERGTALDLSSSGRGLQQTLLILAYMYANPGAVILLDEPDAHLEILRQRQIYDLIARVASDSGTQIIAASHSEVLLNEAADKDLVIAFVGRPHRIGDGQSQVRKALAEIGFDQYYQAEQTGWVLYLEGSTDLAILRASARRLRKDNAVRALERPFVHYVGNRPTAAAHHFHGLREALPNLRGVALFDRLDRETPENPALEHLVWKRREIENYLCTEATLEEYARASAEAAQPMPLFSGPETDRRLTAMREAIAEVGKAMETLGKGSPWSSEAKVSDEFLTPLFRAYFEKIEIPNLMSKKNFYELADHVPEDEIDPEIGEKLDAIAAVADSASPAGEF